MALFFQSFYLHIKYTHAYIAHSQEQKEIMVDGARRIGKSTIVEEFIMQEYLRAIKIAIKEGSPSASLF